MLTRRYLPLLITACFLHHALLIALQLVKWDLIDSACLKGQTVFDRFLAADVRQDCYSRDYSLPCTWLLEVFDLNFNLLGMDRMNIGHVLSRFCRLPSRHLAVHSRPLLLFLSFQIDAIASEVI